MKRETVAEHYGSFYNYQRHELKKAAVVLPGTQSFVCCAVCGGMGQTIQIDYEKSDCGLWQSCRADKRGIEKSGSGYVDKIILALWEVHKDEPYLRRKK